MLAQKLLIILISISIAAAQTEFVWTNNCKSTLSSGINENLPIGFVVCKLSALYRNSSVGITYRTTAGGDFVANATSGAISIARNIDREVATQVSIGVQASAFGSEITEDLRITILDVNDNAPAFVGLPYAATVIEDAAIGTVFFDRILVTDGDGPGDNSDMTVECFPPNVTICSLFAVQARKISPGNFTASIRLLKRIDFETDTFYIMTMMAADKGRPKLNQTVNIIITVGDAQDTPAVFREKNIRFTVVEGRTNVSVGTIEARDGDGGDGLGRPIVIEVVDDPIFEMAPTQNPVSGSNYYRAELRIKPGQSLDREATYGSFYRVNITATELYSITNGTKVPNTTTETVIEILISDINDNRPEFVNGTVYNVTLAENVANRSIVPDLDILIRDRDGTSRNNRMRVSVSKSTFPGTFTINPTDVVGEGSCNLIILDSSKLDFEIPNYRQHRLELLIRETGTSESFNSTAIVNIQVSDVNDHSPEFVGTNGSFFEFDVSEARPVGWVVSNSIRAEDRDSGVFGEITYSISGSSELAINASSGQLTLATRLDYEAKRELFTTVTARDGGGLSAAAVVYVRVLNFNDKAPFFSLDRYTTTIREESTVLIPPLIVRTNDSDSTAPIKFSIISGNTPDNGFRIVNQNSSNLNGELIITKTRGFNVSDTPGASGRFILRIMAEDDGSPPLNSTATIEVIVQDINNNPPIFNPKNYSQIIPEIAAQGRLVVQVQATDNDYDVETNKRISYQMQGGSVDKFSINSLTGEITVLSTNNFDINSEGSEYFLQVIARDGGAPVLSDIATVFITVTDSNNKNPVFDRQLYIYQIREDVSVGTLIGNVSAVDPDRTAALEYSFESTSVIARSPFTSIVSSRAEFDYVTALRMDSNGSIYTQTAMNRDVVAEIQFIAIVRDTNAEVPSVQTATSTVVVQISQTSVRKPIFNAPWTASNPQILVPLPEGLPAGTTVITLTATDPSTRERVSQYRIIPDSNSESAFNLDSSTGRITLTKVIDFENRVSTRLSVTVEATSPSNATALCTVIVIIQDRNDNAPQFLSPSYSFSVSEDARYPQEFGLVVARDADSGDFGSIRYSLQGTGSNLFDLDATLGTLKPASGVTLDREANTQFNFLVRATDSPSSTNAAAQRYTDVPLIITLTDANDNAPTFTNPNFDASIFENIPVGSVIFTATATDPDAGLNGRVSYSITAGNSAGYFSIDPTSGQLSVITSLLGKTAASPYVLTLTASDSGSPRQVTQKKLSVTVRSVTETRGNPVITFPIQDREYNVPEEAEIGTQVLQATARDPDSSGAGLVFSLSGQDASSFRINASTGSIINAVRLDRETRQTFIMVVSVRDASGLDTLRPVKFFIKLSDINDNAPNFPGCRAQYNSQPVLVVVPENENNIAVSTFRACDSDIAPNSNIRYYVTCGNEGNHFSIDQNSGELRVVRPIDREANSEFNICIKANNTLNYTNSVPTNHSILSVRVVVQDADDNGPSFASSQLTVNMQSDSEYNSEVTKLTATDPDLPNNWNHVFDIQRVQFTPKNVRDSVMEKLDAFSIDSASGSIRTRYVDYQSYVGGLFEISARVRDSMSRESAVLVRVNVLGDENLLRFVISSSPLQARLLAQDLLSNASAASSLALTYQKVTHHITTASASDGTVADVCFVARDSSNSILSLRDAQSVLDRNRNSILNAIYADFKIISIGYCNSNSLFKTYNYLGIEGYWWLFIGLSATIILFAVGLIGFVILLYQKYAKMCYTLQYQ